MSELISGEKGAGFLKLSGGFRTAPNFSMMMYQLTFELDVAPKYLPAGRRVYFYMTRNEKDDPNKATVSCSVEVGNFKNV